MAVGVPKEIVGNVFGVLLDDEFYSGPIVFRPSN